ncbi:MAG: DUF1659 domain-containing protein [Bacillaceae bacterium]|nr:DUF1659 domain-containing protein [Bacillaceae bacterium]
MDNILQTRLTLQFYKGADENGKAILATKSFANINILATREKLFATAQALASLQAFELVGVTRSNVYDMVE